MIHKCFKQDKDGKIKGYFIGILMRKPCFLQLNHVKGVGKSLSLIHIFKKGVNAEEALNNAKKTYGRYADAVKYIDPRHE